MVAATRVLDSIAGGRIRRSRLLYDLLVPGVLVIGLCGCRDAGVPTPEASVTRGQPTTPRKLLERMFGVYRDCRTYADNAVYRERWILREDGVVREPPPQMVSVSFARPARIRVTRRVPDAEGGVAEGFTLVSTGSRIYHTLPRFPRQVLETVAPITLTAGNFAVAPHVPDGLLYLPLEDAFPQIDLLLSENPQEDALAANAAPKLLEEGLLGDRACYRVGLSSNAGRRVYWIDKESHLLRRLDLAPGEVREAVDPHDQLKSFERWIEFRDAVVNEELPDEAFDVDVPDDAVVVREWIGGYPGPEPDARHVSPEEQEIYAARLAAYDAQLAAAGAATTGNLTAENATVVQIAPPSMPQTLRIRQAWSAEAPHNFGNVYAFDMSGEPRIFVIDGDRSIAEYQVDGALVKRHEPPVLQNDRINRLASAVDAEGDRWFAVGGVGQPKVHMFDRAWNHHWSFPEHDNPGIGDFLFAPFGDAGSPHLVVGFFGDVGVHGVLLGGRRQWVDRSWQQVWGLALAMDEMQNPVVWTAHGQDIIGRVGKDGPLPPLSVPGRAIVDLAAADVNRDGQRDACGIAFVEPGVYDAIGLDAAGRESWSYRLPKGEYLRSGMLRMVAARGDAVAGWILPAPNGSIHIVSAGGELVDKFNSGKPITGIEYVEPDGEPLLIVASPEGMTAWRLE